MRNKVERTIPKDKNMSRNILTFHVQVNSRYRSQNMNIFNTPINLEKIVGNIFKLVTLFVLYFGKHQTWTKYLQ